jgi:hypothetical protein
MTSKFNTFNSSLILSMKLFTILILLALSTTLNAQDIKMHCAEREISCNNGNKTHFYPVMDCPYFETDTTHIPELILVNAKKYLLDRVGESFYKKLNFYECQIVNFKKFDPAMGTGRAPWMGHGGNKKIRYAIQYYFIVQDSMRYYLSLIFDKNGNILSMPQLPSAKQNPKFDSIISLCDIIHLSENDSIFKGEVQEGISLEYSDRDNVFTWRIEKPPIQGPKPKITIHRFLIMNANNGSVIKRETEQWTTVCEMNSW